MLISELIALRRVGVMRRFVHAAASTSGSGFVQHTVGITSLSRSGFGIATLGNGVVVHVPGVLPAETVRVAVLECAVDPPNKAWCDRPKNEVEVENVVELVQVISPSSSRIKPACDLFTICGGCQLQHMPYNQQLEWKREVVRVLFCDHGINVPVRPTEPSPAQLGYRSKLTPHYQRRQNLSDPINAIGFDSVARPPSVIDVPTCPLAMRTINKALPAVRAWTATGNRSKNGASLLLRASATSVPPGQNLPTLDKPSTFLQMPTAPRKSLPALAPSSEPWLGCEYETVCDHTAEALESVGTYRFAFRAGEFFQCNPFILPALVDHVLAAARGSDNGPKITTLVDTYCGVGLFSICGSKHFDSCIGVEISKESIVYARRNSRANNVSNCTFHWASAEKIFESVHADPDRTSVVVDPPRAGCSLAFLRLLIKLAPRIIVYCACNPSSQVRDCMILMDAGYVITAVQPFDMFPQTKHIENVITLERPAR